MFWEGRLGSLQWRNSCRSVSRCRCSGRRICWAHESKLSPRRLEFPAEPLECTPLLVEPTTHLHIGYLALAAHEVKSLFCGPVVLMHQVGNDTYGASSPSAIAVYEDRNASLHGAPHEGHSLHHIPMARGEEVRCRELS